MTVDIFDVEDIILPEYLDEFRMRTKRYLRAKAEGKIVCGCSNSTTQDETYGWEEQTIAFGERAWFCPECMQQKLEASRQMYYGWEKVPDGLPTWKDIIGGKS